MKTPCWFPSGARFSFQIYSPLSGVDLNNQPYTPENKIINNNKK